MGSLIIIESILRDRKAFFWEIRKGESLPEKMRAMLISSVAFLALYGATATSHREPQRQPALARIRKSKRPAAR